MHQGLRLLGRRETPEHFQELHIQHGISVRRREVLPERGQISRDEGFSIGAGTWY